MSARHTIPNPDRLGSFGQAFGDIGEYLDTPYIEPGMLPTFVDLQRAVGINPGSQVGGREGLRLPSGRVALPNDNDPEKALLYLTAYKHAHERWLDKQFASYMSGRRSRGNASLGTYRSKRKGDDLRRAAERRTTCIVCDAPMPEGSYSNALTCSPKCRKARQRLAPKVSHVSADRMDRSRGPLADTINRSTTLNYYEHLQTEADSLARRKLARAFEGPDLDHVLAALDVIHASNMAQASGLKAPSLTRDKYTPITNEMVGNEVIYPFALGLMKAASEAAGLTTQEKAHV